jgi:hypothetical protein
VLLRRLVASALDGGAPQGHSSAADAESKPPAMLRRRNALARIPSHLLLLQRPVTITLPIRRTQVRVFPDMLVSEAILRVAEAGGVPAGVLVLSHEGRPLRPSSSLSEARVLGGSHILAHARVLGG